MISRPQAALAAVVLAFVLVPAAALAAGPPFPDPIGGQLVYDDAGVLDDATRMNLDGMASSIRTSDGLAVVVYTQRQERAAGVAPDLADGHAAALLAQWHADMVFLADLPPDDGLGEVGLATSDRMAERIDAAELEDLRAEMAGWLEDGELGTALVVGVSTALIEVWSPDQGGTTAGPNPGPPFPEPIVGQAVYDFAGILSSEAIVEAEASIDAIEARTGAEVVVYSQLVDYGVTTDETRGRAAALIDQWGIGRKGFDDGMVVFFDIDPSLEHGQVQLYAAPGFEATFLTNSERQAIFENDMLPYLREADFDGALRVAIQRIDAAATPANAQRLELGRQVNAVLGLIGAPIVFLGLTGWAFFHWRRFGKDPVYLDDPSILMPAPPPDLTAASGAFVMDGGTSRRALTTAMLDLASRGLISFREEKEGLFGMSTKVGIDTDPPKGDDAEEAWRRLNARRPTGPAEAVALARLRSIDGGDSYIKPDDLLKFGSSVPVFDEALEKHVVKMGWVVERPSTVTNRWVARGIVALIAGIAAVVIGANIPMSGLVMLGVGAGLAGVAMMIIARGMPSVTMAGAMIRAMLAAYKRTLHRTMEQARSMQQVVEGAGAAGLTWLETPDQVVVWGTALGLQGDIEEVLKRSLEDVERGATATSTYFPGWYRDSEGASFASAAAAGSGGSIFSGSAVPDLGGMMSALGTIGDSPSSSGNGGGGFGGGSSGGGGGGAGGGF